MHSPMNQLAILPTPFDETPRLVTEVRGKYIENDKPRNARPRQLASGYG